MRQNGQKIIKVCTVLAKIYSRAATVKYKYVNHVKNITAEIYKVDNFRLM